MYRNVSLYPIVEISAIPLPNDAIATAMLRVTLNPGFVYFRSYQDLRVQGGARSSGICDYLQDYRTGTILDVIGSVGGLFALLQAIHLLLFGRSLMWGLTGAMLISPFGLVGALSSKKFQQHLQEHYHRTPTEDNPGLPRSKKTVGLVFGTQL
ncbi:unnamed protein product [Rhizoctonia solani]|uniref:Uncharacterized protein n=1 Tax=Rhizoctonia solani TaxID=456999 RepID=A0A8H3C018_9AGAM|nr:unnamed protein product [Rhizoctonia solani]